MTFEGTVEMQVALPEEDPAVSIEEIINSRRHKRRGMHAECIFAVPGSCSNILYNCTNILYRIQ